MFLQVRNLSFYYEKNKSIIDDISLSIKGPNILLLQGKNGAGKTTLMKLLSGILKPKRGTILINNIDIHRHRNLAFLTTTLLSSPLNFEDIKLEKIVKNLKYPLDKSLINLLKLDINKTFWQLSEGQKDKFRVYLAMFSRSIILLDEPFKSLDKHSTQVVKELLVDLAHYKLLVVSSHKNILNTDNVIQLGVENV